MKTDDLIRHLSANATPVRRLPPAWAQAAQWLLVALFSVALVVLLVSPRPDLAVKLGEMRFLIEEGAAFATAVTAAMAAFCLATPGHSRKLALLPAVPLALWFTSLGLDCLRAWLAFGWKAFQVELDWVCLPAIAMVGAVPALAIVAMLRRGAPLAPRMTVMLGGLAAAAIGDFGLRLFHPQDAGLTVLIWQFGSVLLFSALAGWSGHFFLRWRHVRLAG
ncbi:NrsF family protein [Chelativorans alearense]|uniref:NrsF family protein n=1 Tax=Chelativorans alearense TaxID=2681495 RepID=UPI001FE366EA|nr:DUF1109 domain-containing protein [Chelativorans alearense]